MDNEIRDLERRLAEVKARAGQKAKPARAIRVRKSPTLRRLFGRCARVLKREGLEGEGLGIFPGLAKYDHNGIAPDSPCGRVLNEICPGFRWIACYAVEGSNEGHYVHVELIGHLSSEQVAAARDAGLNPETLSNRVLVMLEKTFLSMEHANRIASRLAVLLGA